jgi:radical SAM superfamily enzyme with C-terminal helix-hairpin-helix motif
LNYGSQLTKYVSNICKMNEKTQKSYTLTKKIAKHGKQSVIVIPTFLSDELKPKTVVEIRINVVKGAEEDVENL